MIQVFPEVKKNFGFGCMRLPMLPDGEVDKEQFCTMIDRFLEAGFNYFDTAHGYLGGKSETALKECLVDRYPRESFLLTDKLTGPYFNCEADIRPFFESQLKICGVEYFDFYLMHAQNATVYEKFKACRAYETVIELIKEGKVKHLGLSIHDKAEVLEQILTDYPEVEVVQIQFNYLDYNDPGVDSRRLYEVCEKFGKPVIMMEPVKGGHLVNLLPEAQKVFDELQKDKAVKQSNASYALRFTGSFPNARIVLSGMSDTAQVEDNIVTMGDFKPLSFEEMAAIHRVCGVFGAVSMIPCTACRYCVLDNDCPKKISIPELFSCYNMKTTFRSLNQEENYSLLTGGGRKASDCIKCGKCEKICPQHLKIREFLDKVAGEFEK